MRLKEHLQFLAMMIPTFLLLSLIALTLAFPSKSMGAPLVAVAEVTDSDE